MAEIQRYLGYGKLYSSPPQPEPRFLYDLSSSVAVSPENTMAHTLLARDFMRCESASTDSGVDSLRTTEPHVTAAVPAATGPDDG